MNHQDALVVVRTAGACRKWSAAVLDDEELTSAILWWWSSPMFAARVDLSARSIVDETRPKLATIAGAWMEEFQPERARMLDAARQAEYRARKRALAEGASLEEAASRGARAYTSAIERALQRDPSLSQYLTEYRPTAKRKRAKMEIAEVVTRHVEPGGAHRLDECVDPARCRWHQAKWETEQRRTAEFFRFVTTTHEATCSTCSTQEGVRLLPAA